MSTHLSVLLTRPAAVADKTASDFEKAGIYIVREPLMEIIPAQLLSIPLKNYQAILTTSSSAIRSLANFSFERDIPLWCVGASSRQTAIDLNFQNIYSPNQDTENVEGLVVAIRRNLHPGQGRLLYAKGDPVSRNLKEILSAFGYEIDDITLYKSQARKGFSAEAKAFLSKEPVPGKFKGITFYSPRTVDIFLTLCEKESIRVPFEGFIALSLSEAISKKLEKFSWFRIITASTTPLLIANVKEIIE